MVTLQPASELTSGHLLTRERPSPALGQNPQGLLDEVLLGWALEDWGSSQEQAHEGAELTVQELAMFHTGYSSCSEALGASSVHTWEHWHPTVAHTMSS